MTVWITPSNAMPLIGKMMFAYEDNRQQKTWAKLLKVIDGKMIFNTMQGSSDIVTDKAMLYIRCSACREDGTIKGVKCTACDGHGHLIE